MADEYDRILDEMMAKCEALRIGQTREECCKEKGLTTCPPLTQEEQPDVHPVLLLGGSISVACAILYVAVRKKWPQRAWGKFGEKTKAIVSGWAVWLIIVFSYVLIMQPYGYRMNSEDHTNLVMWLTLPPLAALAIYLWFSRFVRAKK